MFIIKNKGICLVLFIFFLSILTSCGTSNNTSTKVVNIDNVVKETFLTDKGYSEELSKHVSERVFKYTNIYNVYAVNDPQYKKPFKVDFSLKEDSQSVKKDIVYVKMTYSVMIKDATGKSIGGSRDIPITFTVKITGTNWYITDKYEAA
ncbi:hypothetical protein SAMN02745134_01574 [Clostridium acidisoli DSM 12555]|uniref:Uncharacterized protein n=1 Tax=Clostridium acidisoli DSM 12555 TaxID=1121291 RepID=A0A1W1XEA5_9CLOT|nr:hypothetical protein [Clostridium acidisoli]SMC22182.1 hypothetical protein SAMN02745134_01574 [Clostridium acidisoli DSM 12555]